MVDIQSTAAEIRRGKEKEDRKKTQGKNITVATITTKKLRFGRPLRPVAWKRSVAILKGKDK